MLSKDLVAASSKPLILSVLAEGESYGYEIIQRIREVSDGEMQWKDGMLYPVLRKLEAQGLVESEWRVSESGRRRRYYRLKQEGRESLKVEKTQWSFVYSTLMKFPEFELCST